jgi:DNA-binding MarR family transcriptional regulator
MTPETQKTARQILDTVPLVMRTLASEMRKTGHAPAPTHFRLLVMLAKGPHNLSELASKHAVRLPTMSNSITALVERGWVTRERAADNRRMVLVKLTPAGEQVLCKIQEEAEARIAGIISALSPEECDQVSTGLEVLRSAFAPVAIEENCEGASTKDDPPASSG